VYFHKDLRPALGRSLTPAEAYARAGPERRRDWFPAGPPAATVDHGAGAGWDADPAALAKATQVGMAALAASYGSALPDGMAPCGTCPACQYGRPAQCRRPMSKAEARLRAGQALDADRRRTEATVAELEMLAVELAAGLD
jgi:hypothetical protein